MNVNDLLVNQLQSTSDMLKMHLGDMSDADLMSRPCDTANHPIWQLGHLVAGEAWMMNQIKPGIMPELPAGFVEKFKKETAGENDPKKLGTKEELLGLFDKVRSATISYAKSVKPEELDKPAPEKLRSFMPTVGAVLALQPGHVMMHIGQMQVARRQVGKPVLF